MAFMNFHNPERRMIDDSDLSPMAIVRLKKAALAGGFAFLYFFFTG